MHKDSIHLTKKEYDLLFASKLLAKYSCRVDKIGEYYKVTATMPESSWQKLEVIISGESE